MLGFVLCTPTSYDDDTACFMKNILHNNFNFNVNTFLTPHKMYHNFTSYNYCSSPVYYRSNYD